LALAIRYGANQSLPRFHGIDKLDRALVDMIAGKAFECPDVKS
jgi:hypothetical protein